MGDHIAIVSKSLKILIFVDLVAPTDIKISCPNLVGFRVVTEEWDDISSFPDQMIENILSSSPFLRSLEVDRCKGFDQLVITSESLKVLILEGNETNRIEISCPNLEKLYLYSWGEEMLKVMNLPSSICGTIDYAPWDFNKILVEQFLDQLQHVKKLTIESDLIRIVSELEDEGIQSLPLLNSKCLTLNVQFGFGFALLGIAYALRSPKLETLVINVKFFYKDLIISSENYWSTNCPTAFTCLMCHLKTVKLIGLSENADKFTQKLVLNFIEFILENARVLKKMIVDLQNSGTDFVIEVSQKLLSFPRYSRCASVELLCSP